MKHIKLACILIMAYFFLFIFSCAVFGLSKFSIDNENIIIIAMNWSATMFAPVALLITFNLWKSQKNTEIIAEQCKLIVIKVIELEHVYLRLRDGVISSNKTFENVKLQLNKFRELRAIIKEENKFLQECFRNSNFKNEIQTFDKAIFSLQSQFSDLVNNFENIKGNTKVPILDEETNPFIRFKRELMKYALYEK